MWQRNLASVHSRLQGDKVENVLTVRPRRVLVLTDRHVMYCRARFLDHAHTVRLRWILDISNVNNILGVQPPCRCEPVLSEQVSIITKGAATWPGWWHTHASLPRQCSRRSVTVAAKCR